MKIRTISLLLVATVFAILPAVTQETFPRNDVRDQRLGAYAFTHATIHVDHHSLIEDGTMLIQEGKIEAVGTDLQIPDGYQEINLRGYHLYPSLIDLYTHYGLPKVKRASASGFSGKEVIDPTTRGPYNANDGIKAHFRASSSFNVDPKQADALRKSGFGTVLTHRPDGFARGTSSLVTLAESSANETVLMDAAAAHFSFNRGSSRQSYPRSMMGYISLLRQTFLDVAWYGAQDPRPFADNGLEGWIESQHLPKIFEANSWINALRADRLGDEFGVQFIIKSGGNAYQRIDQIKASEATLIVPIDFPHAYEVEDPIDAEKVSLKDMLHWELAPSNAAVLERNQVPFVLTSHGLKKKGSFRSNVQKAIDAGLSERTALKALTSLPAALIGMSDRIGSLTQGKIANFLITDGALFDPKTKIYENWIQGKAFAFKSLAKTDLAGQYTLAFEKNRWPVKVTESGGKYNVTLSKDDTTELKAKAVFSEDLVTLSFPNTPKGKMRTRLSGWRKDAGWSGQGQDEAGNWFSWRLQRSDDSEDQLEDKSDTHQELDEAVGPIIYPFLAFGTEAMPLPGHYLIQKAKVWTNEAEGILDQTDVRIMDGKIAEIGQDLAARGGTVIDGTGKHLTPGIIDEHTHIAGGGNDVLTNSAMVRIGDQVNSEDINIYRGLAGGVTAAQVLHGSANPIGGQSAVIKLRWGAAPEELKIKGAPEFIKFALGENVKRSRNSESIRFPQTRMGVEQVFVDAFTNALAYEKQWKDYQNLSAANKSLTIAPRRDLAMEAILEIINKERFITCHSYVQSEINMLMHVAEQFDFNVNTFTHIMEGYKVADKMKAHGVGGSSFSDWFNYKWEVRYAIPYNAVIMHNEGVVTAINSDDANMGRRLNQEAAKSIKYGGMSEEDALKLVTLNPAKLMRLEDRMGSIKVGKDADLVLWTDHPLSIYAKSEKTFVDGTIYFDIEQDQIRRQALQRERARLVQKMMAAKKEGKPTQKAYSKMDMLIHCESVLGEEHFHQH